MIEDEYNRISITNNATRKSGQQIKPTILGRARIQRVKLPKVTNQWKVELKKPTIKPKMQEDMMMI